MEVREKMSLYVKVFTNFYTHRKTMRLRAVLGDDAFWIPPRLWSYAAENQADGDFTGYEPAELAMLIGYNKDACSMLEALKKTGFLDGMKIHGWEDHNDYHAVFADRAKKAAAARWKNTNSKKGSEKNGTDRKGKEMIGDKHSLKDASSIPDSLKEVDGFVLQWEEYATHRKQIKKPLTPLAEQGIFKSLMERPAQAVEALQISIRRSWQGFEWAWIDKDKNNGNGHKPKDDETLHSKTNEKYGF